MQRKQQDEELHVGNILWCTDIALRRDENQTAAADISQSVDACTLTAAPLSCALLHFNSSQSHKSTLMLASVHQQLNGAHALHTAFYSSIGSNLLPLNKSRCACVGGTALFKINPKKLDLYRVTVSLLWLIHTHLVNTWRKFKSHNTHRLAQHTWSIKRF